MYFLSHNCFTPINPQLPIIFIFGNFLVHRKIITNVIEGEPDI